MRSPIKVADQTKQAICATICRGNGELESDRVNDSELYHQLAELTKGESQRFLCARRQRGYPQRHERRHRRSVNRRARFRVCAGGVRTKSL